MCIGGDGGENADGMLTAGFVGTTERRPTEPVFLYDGSCGFCRRWVGRARRLDPKHRVRFLPLQDAEAAALSGRSYDALSKAAHLVRQDGAVFAGAAAIRELLRHLRGGKVPARLMRMPGVMPVAERCYAWIARRWGPVK